MFDRGGRLRPIISGPGCQSNGDGGVTSTIASSDTSYGTFCGTSMSGPTLAGMGALVLQDYRTHFAGGDPFNAMMKVWFCQSAADVSNPGPDYHTGYGSARAVDTIEHMRSGNWDSGSLDHQDVTLYDITVGGGSSELKITMAWDDVAGTPNVVGSLVNDLDLVAIAPDGTRHFPWTLDPNFPSANATQDREDHLNNIEQVAVASPMAGTWRIAVVGTSVAQGPQNFAITSSHALDAGSIWIGEDRDVSVPSEVDPLTPVAVAALVAQGADTLTPGSVTLNYRFDGGAFNTSPMTASGSGFAGNIPGAPCGSTIEYFFSADGSSTGAISANPGDDGMFTIAVGETVTHLVEDFESTPGWTVIGGITGQSTGRWEVGIPVGGGDRGDPETDADGSGQCFLTGNASGNTDVDNSETILISPDLDATVAADPVISYQRWFHNSFGDPFSDPFTVDISDNAGISWTTLETFGLTSESAVGGWVTASFRIADFVTPTNQVRVRFTASDYGAGAVVEAGIDDLRITEFVCVQTACSFADCNADGALNLDDVDCFVAAFLGSNLASADCDANGSLNLDDVDCFVTSFLAGCP